MTGLVALGTAAVLWFGARQVLEGAMTAGALVVFMTYLGRLFRPIQHLARAGTNIAQATVGLERVKAVLDADERLPRSATTRPGPSSPTSPSSSSPARSSDSRARAAAASRRS